MSKETILGNLGLSANFLLGQNIVVRTYRQLARNTFQHNEILSLFEILKCDNKEKSRCMTFSKII